MQSLPFYLYKANMYQNIMDIDIQQVQTGSKVAAAAQLYSTMRCICPTCCCRLLYGRQLLLILFSVLLLILDVFKVHIIPSVRG